MKRISKLTQSVIKLSAVIVLATVSTGAFAALNGYMSATGETQGEIKGGSTQAGREDKMEVVEFAHSVAQRIDSASGLPTGKRQHRPIHVTKPVDKASPILFAVLTQSEILTEVRIDFWHPNRSGVEYQFYTVELINARITNISQHSGSTPELLTTPAMETISLVYDKIIWTWQDGGITAEDDWETPSP